MTAAKLFCFICSLIIGVDDQPGIAMGLFQTRHPHRESMHWCMPILGHHYHQIQTLPLLCFCTCVYNMMLSNNHESKAALSEKLTTNVNYTRNVNNATHVAVLTWNLLRSRGISTSLVGGWVVSFNIRPLDLYAPETKLIGKLSN